MGCQTPRRSGEEGTEPIGALQVLTWVYINLSHTYRLDPSAALLHYLVSGMCQFLLLWAQVWETE